MTAKDMLRLVLQIEATLKLYRSSEKGKSHAIASAANRSRGFAPLRG
jgi:hypothetical protein